MRALACIAIVTLHVFYVSSVLYGDGLSNGERFAADLGTTLCMWAVPCFLMVTGALLLDAGRELTYKKLFKKYIFRIFAALLIFGMLFRVLDMILDHEVMSISGLLKGFVEILTGTSWSHLWYLYVLIGLYLLLPFFKKIPAAASDKEIQYLLLLNIVFLSLFPVLKIWDIDVAFTIPIATIYPFYLFCGYAISEGKLPVKKWQAILLMLIGAGGIIATSWFKIYRGMDYMSKFSGYSSIFVIFLVVGVFTLLYNMNSAPLRVLKWLLFKLDHCSFGIYLLHMIPVRIILRYCEFNPFDYCPGISIPLLIFGILLNSWLVVWLLKKIPYVSVIL